MALTLVLVGCASPVPASTPSSGNLLGVDSFPRDQGPFADGENVSLAEAEGTVPYHLYRPDSQLASDETIRAVFVETRFDEEGNPDVKAAIDYESGLLLIVSTAPQAMTEDPSAFLGTEGRGERRSIRGDRSRGARAGHRAER